MGKFLLNIVVIILIGYAFILSYNNLITKTEERVTKEMQLYVTQNQSINQLQSSHPKSLTKKIISEYDKKK